MFKNYLIAILSALLLFVAYQKYFDKFSDMQSIGTVEDFTLLDHSGVSHNLHYLGDKKAIVLVSYGIGCPIARHSLFTLNELRRRFKNDNVEFLLLDANFGDDRNNLQEEAKEFSIDLPILIDDSQTIAQSLNIERTAEAILIDPKTWSIIYRGSIDDRLGYETQKTKATNNYLAQAISDLLKRKTPEVQRTATKGCLINYLKTPSQISYSEQIVPILRDNCLTCHNQSGIGPWSMSDFKTIHSWSKMIREVVRQKRMPPREVDPYFSTVKNNRSLTAEEKRLLISWIEQGAKKDSADDPLPTLHQKVAQTKWPLGEPDIIIKAEEVTKLPATGVLDWIQRYQTSPIDRDIWAKAIYYLPSNKKVVHHASFWAKIASPYQTATAYNVASTVEEVKQWVESRKNNTEFVPPEKSADWEMVQGYAPGLKMFTFPEGTGKFFPRGTELLFITHYLTTGKPEEDQPEVGIYLYKEPNPKVKPLVHKFLENNLWEIPANQNDFEIVSKFKLDDNITLYGAGPHMHYRGKSMKLLANLPNGEVLTLLSVPKFDYDFNVWVYDFVQPVKLPKNTELVIRQIFDNTAQNPKNPNPNRSVTFDYQRLNEMNWSMILYTVESS